jgi:hypothetical protein
METPRSGATIEERRDELLRGDFGTALAAQRSNEMRLQMAEFHLRKAVELAAALDATDLRKDFAGKVDESAIDETNSVVEPAIGRAKATISNAQAALNVLTSRNTAGGERG